MPNSTMTTDVRNTEWNQAAEKAKQAAASVGEMASHATSAVGTMASHAACDVGRKADDFTASAGAGIQGLGDRLSRQAPHTGILGNMSQGAAEAVKDAGEYLEGAKLSGMADDLAVLVRRNPIPAVFIALGLGWFVGRKLGS